MHAAACQTFVLNLTPQMTRCRQRIDECIMLSLNCRHFGLSWKPRHGARNILQREDIRCLPTASVLSEDHISSDHFEDFSVSVADNNDARELKIRIEVSGNKTQRIFDDVFQKMVAAAQPIPGFRRVKGGGASSLLTSSLELSLSINFDIFPVFVLMANCCGLPGKTRDIPKDILLEVLGPSKVFKEVIKKIINLTVAEYVEKERLIVCKDLRVEQSFDDLESNFVEGEKFSFDVVLELQK